MLIKSKRWGSAVIQYITDGKYVDNSNMTVNQRSRPFASDYWNQQQYRRGSMLLIHSASLLPIQTAANGYGSKFETHENYSRDWVMFSNKELHPTSILLRPPSLLRLIFIQFFVGWNTSKTSWSNDPISFREISRLFGWKSLTKSLVSWLNPTILGWSVEPPEISGASPA